MNGSGGQTRQLAASIGMPKGVALFALALAFVLHSPLLRAQADVDSTCGATLENPQTAQTPDSDPKQKLQYCQAAKSAKEGANADRALYKVWGAVGVVCTYACTSSIAGAPINEHACTGATMGGSATQGVVTKDFASSLTSIASAGGGYAVNQAANANAAKDAAKEGKEGKDGVPAEKPKKKDYAACMNAATAVSTSYSKHKSMKNNESSAQNNLNSAIAVEAAATAGVVSAYKPSTGGADGNLAASGGGTGALAQQGSSGSGGSSAQACATRGSGASVIQCAVESDRNIPSFVTTPRFAQEFQKKTGQSLNNFLTSEDTSSPTRPLAEAMAGAVPMGQGARLASALETLNQSLDSESMGGTYVGGGGASGSSDGSGDEMAAQMGAMMQGLMDQMNPEKGKEAEKTGVFAVDFAYRANQGRSLAAVSDDKKLSIFDRVTYRYHFVSGRTAQGEKKQ